MRRTLLAVTFVLAALALLDSALGQQAGKPQPVHLTVLLPAEDADLEVDGKATKQGGVKRVFVSPDLAPGKTFTYTLTATWMTNNYTTIIRTRKVAVQAGKDVEVDMRNPDPKNPDRFLIRFVPTPDEVIDAMCKIAQVGKNDVVYDLGCGDGRIVIAAVTRYGAKRGVGIDIDEDRIKEANAAAKKAGVSDKVEFRKGDVLDIKDLKDANVVMLYMGEDVNLRLRPILQKTLRPGSRVVSHDFPMGDWKPDRKIDVTDSDGDDHEVYLWKIGK